MAAGSDIADTVRDMKWLKIIVDGKLIRICAAADGFLYNMVRIIVGTLVDVGYGRISPEDMPDTYRPATAHARASPRRRTGCI